MTPAENLQAYLHTHTFSLVPFVMEHLGAVLLGLFWIAVGIALSAAFSFWRRK